MPPRKFQFHLGTLLLVTIVASAFVGLNFYARFERAFTYDYEPAYDHPLRSKGALLFLQPSPGEARVQGWPIPIRETILFENQFPSLIRFRDNCTLWIAIDAAIALACLCAVFLISEKLYRLHTEKRQR